MIDLGEHGPAPNRIRYATTCLRISVILYVLVGLALSLVPFGWDPAVEPEYALRAGIIWFSAVVSLAMAGLAEVVIRGLGMRRRWAWKIGVGLFVVYLPSAFLPLGIAGLYGLLSAGTRAEFSAPRCAAVRRHA